MHRQIHDIGVAPKRAHGAAEIATAVVWTLIPAFGLMLTVAWLLTSAPA